MSPAVAAFTPSSNPESVPTPSVLSVGQRTVTVRIDPPSIPNGDIAVYMILANGETVQTGGTSGNFTVSGLTPYTRYVLLLAPQGAALNRDSRHTLRYELAVRVCTRATATAPAGCTVSDVTNVTTMPARPEGQGAPRIEDRNAHSMTISWTEPSEPNSVLL